MTRSKWLLVLSIAPAVIASVAGVKIEGIVSSLVGGWALICWVLAFILRKKKNAPAAAQPALRAADPARRTVSFAVAGVTFRNDDHSDRQSLIIRLKNSGRTSFNVTLKPYTYKGEAALAVYLDGLQIGSVPRGSLPEVLAATRSGRYSAKFEHFNTTPNAQTIGVTISVTYAA